MNSAPPVFHLAIPVSDLAETRRFYGGVLGCPEGRSAERWVDFDFFGHQLSVHVRDADPARAPAGRDAGGEVDGERVDIPHFGVVLPRAAFEALIERLRRKQVHFLSPPATRFAGRAGEQASFFLRDPGGNTLEFKSFSDPNRMFSG